MSTHSYDPRTIALLAELIHPPLELQAARVQEIHNELYKGSEFQYQNFSVGPEGIALSNPVENPGAVSMVNFLPDRIQLREEMTGTHVDDFRRRLEHVLRTAIEKLSLPILVARQYVVRSLISPRHYADSREFLGTGVCRLQNEQLQDFERPVGLFGFKMIFPVAEGENDYHTLRVESFNQDPRNVFLEDIATFTQPVMPAELEELGGEMMATYEFLKDKALSFLARFDRNPEAGGFELD